MIIKDKISVVIPVYNVAKYLDVCIKSVINQTYKDLEIILVDDGSTDNSGKMCDEYKEKDERIIVIHKQNGGLSSARNEGIKIATGKYLTFIDSDDYITNDMIEELYLSLTNTNSDVSICKITKNENKLDCEINNETLIFNSHDAIKEILLDRLFTTSASAKLYKKELFNNIMYPAGMLYEDYATTYKLFHLSDKISYTSSNKYYYRYNDEGITKSKFTNKQLDYFKVSKEILNFTKDNYCDLVKYVNKRTASYAISFYRFMCMGTKYNKDTSKFIINELKPNLLKYIFSNEKIAKKIYGILMCIMPKLLYNIENIRK